MSINQVGGRIQPKSDWRLWRFASLIHFLRQDHNYSQSGQKRIKPFRFHTLESSDQNLIFPVKSQHQPLDRNYLKLTNARLRKMSYIYQLVQAQTGGSLTQTALHRQIPFSSKKEKQDYLKAVADNLWGFLKHKEGDLIKEVDRQRSKSTRGFKANQHTHYGHTIGTGTFARKIAELISSLIIIQEGVPAKWVYESEGVNQKMKDYSLFLKNLLVKLLLYGDESQRKKVKKILKTTPVDLIISKLWQDRSLKRILEIDSRSKKLEIFDQLEKVRYLGNRSAHAGHPGDWDPKLSDSQQEQLAEALHDLLDIFLSDYLEVNGY